MKTLSLICVLLALFSACKKGGANKQDSIKIPPGGESCQANVGMNGVILETMDVATYTYVRLKTDKEEVWAAAPLTKVNVGDTVVLSDPFPMKKYTSKSLNRTFDTIYFASAMSPCSKMIPGQNPHASGAEASSGHPKIVAEEMDIGKIEKAAGGATIAEIFQEAGKFQGKPVMVRAKVLKANYGIMNKTWLHVRDGTGGESNNELVVTTTEKPKRGDIVLIKGVFAETKNISAGYSFHGFIEDAQVTIEKK